MNICLQTMNIMFHSMLNPSNRRKEVNKYKHNNNFEAMQIRIGRLMCE